MKKIQSKTIVFLTGAYVSHACWDHWRSYFEELGYTTIAPPWLHKNADASTLRSRHPDPALARVSLPDLLHYHIEIIKKLPERPILIGHSFGGLMGQVILNKGYAAACIAIHAVPPMGVFPYEFTFLKSNLATLGIFTSLKKTFLMPFTKWQYAFTNGLPYELQKSSYYELVTPESKRMARDGLGSAAHVDFEREHEPLLLLAGTEDQCIPAHLSKRVFKSYRSKNSVTEYVEKDRNHFVLGAPTWKEDAEFIYNWIKQN